MASNEPTELEALLLLFQRFTNLPEIYDFLSDPELMTTNGDKRFLNFLDLFGGLSITVPDRQRVAAMVRDIAIFRSMLENSMRPNVDRLAQLYSLPVEQVRQINARVRRAVDHQSKAMKELITKGKVPGRRVIEDDKGPGKLAPVVTEETKDDRAGEVREGDPGSAPAGIQDGGSGGDGSQGVPPGGSGDALAG